MTPQHSLINYADDYSPLFTELTLVHKGYVDDHVPVIPSSSYTHNQNIAASTWTINHNLGFKPGGIKVFDSANAEWIGAVTYPDNNNIIISFGSAAFAGKAYLS